MISDIYTKEDFNIDNISLFKDLHKYLSYLTVSPSFIKIQNLDN